MKKANTEHSAGKIKWRQHEMILVTAGAIIILAGYAWQLHNTGGSEYAAAFIDNHVAFSLFKNAILPDVIMGLVIYLAYLWINLYTIPRLLFPKKFNSEIINTSASFSKPSFIGFSRKVFQKYLWLIIQLALLVFIMGCVFDLSTYLRHEWQLNYPGFSIFFNPNNPRSQLNLGEGFFAAISITAIYTLYLILRETIIHFIQSSKQKEYNVTICNKVTQFFLQFIQILVFFKSFKLVYDPQSYTILFLVVPAIFAMFISNVYWLFPLKGNASFFSKKIIIRLLSTSFVYAAPLIIFIHEAIPVAFLYSWAIQLFIITPVTWWYYQSNKDKILQLRIIETALVKSKADIRFLRSQINPHFLFNVLNTLYGTALQENAARTAEGIQKLGDMMRFMLHENNLDFIEMHKEIDYLKNYIALQKLRTQSSPDIIIEDNISEQNCHHTIAPMLLIPLVENAFKHGISLQEKSWISINLNCSDKEILFEVHNSMHEKIMNDTEQEKSGIGFNNVVERLKLIYGERFQIAVNKDGKEFSVKLVIQPSLHSKRK